MLNKSVKATCGQVDSLEGQMARPDAFASACLTWPALAGLSLAQARALPRTKLAEVSSSSSRFWRDSETGCDANKVCKGFSG